MVQGKEYISEGLRKKLLLLNLLPKVLSFQFGKVYGKIISNHIESLFGF
jgi:hypothetical protein